MYIKSTDPMFVKYATGVLDLFSLRPHLLTILDHSQDKYSQLKEKII